MSLYSTYKTDKESEIKGAWFTLGETSDGKDIRFLICRAGPSNVKFISAYNRIVKPKNGDIQRGTMKLDGFQKLLVRLYSQVIVLDWENVTDEDGKELPFSPQNVEMVLNDLPDLFELVVEKATNMEGFRQQNIKEDAESL